MAIKEMAFNRCKFLKYIPEGLEGLACLKKRHMSKCGCLLEFAAKVSMLVAIEELHFGGCKSFKEIMKGLESLTCLKKLYMTKCVALDNF